MNKPVVKKFKPRGIYTEIRGVVRLVDTNDGGRRNPACVGYRPHMRFPHSYLSAGFTWIDNENIRPGEAAEALLIVGHPLKELTGLEAGATMDLTEGARKIGEVRVIEVQECSG